MVVARYSHGQLVIIDRLREMVRLAAGVAEVSVDRTTGKIKVHNFWAAIDAGLAVQPRNIAAQTEGSIVYALGHVLREKITIRNGRVLESNYTDYEVTRMSDVPNIEVKVVSTDNPPTGAGEDGVPVVACAVGNAIAALTGVRLREIPFTPERVLKALEKKRLEVYSQTAEVFLT